MAKEPPIQLDKLNQVTIHCQKKSDGEILSVKKLRVGTHEEYRVKFLTPKDHVHVTMVLADCISEEVYGKPNVKEEIGERVVNELLN